MKQNHTDITIVLDRSGSMSSVVDDTIGGYNRFLDDQRKAPGTAAITLHQFDTEFETPFKTQDVKTAPELTTKIFIPRGMTALLDAIGRAIVDTGARLDSSPASEKAEKVVFVIITDGHENSSREYTQMKIHEMIDHQRSKYAWEFVFLGANQDAIKVAGSLCINAANSMTYAHNSVGTQSAFHSTASNLSGFRSGKLRSMAYSTTDREKQKKAGAIKGQ